MTPTQIAPKLYNYASILDDTTREQALALAELPFVHPHIALMPDAHAGKGSSVGTVIPTKGAVIPAAVGVDIGCGMIAVETNYTLADLEADPYPGDSRGLPGRLRELRLAIEASIPVSAGNYNKTLAAFEFTAEKIVELENIARYHEVDLTHSPKWREQLGTLGSGNHFIELCLDATDTVWLFLHSGSRGVGNKIAQKHIKIAQEQRAAAGDELADRDHAWLDEGTPEFAAYIRELHWAQQFAYLNRAEMMDRFVSIFANWLEVNPETVEKDRVNAHHNYTVHETIAGEDVWLTRKGAIDANDGVRGVIPGSMGTRSYVVRGKGSITGLHSAPHGAGRVFSRTKAKKLFTQDDLRQRMAGIEYRDSAEFIDEIPDAYKSIDVVMADASTLVDIEHELRQILNVKGN
ncbi:RtcB family protein [Rhodococcoides fascians]|uniref:RtcB family protein n=1 Tax=Rhodococcoides fascians TaxID=1828 RepID=UPI00050C239D|nr:RtcB family protein [Rhodococcus fascians]